ncbi:hypothetical protein APHAL10511_004883 [Amanita phalloides]|nr:hypothetical protein APHAL10511_004883 [Amanita phalloides]
MLDKNVLISCIFIGIALIVYFFYWNRLLALILGFLARVLYWNAEGSRIWLDIGSVHFSVLTGRILFKDLRYHSSNQTIKIVKGQIQWRYWIRNPTTENELSSPVGEEPKPPFRPLSCRIQLSLQGFEWFLYNRTAAYDDIISQMEKSGNLSRSETRSTDRRRFMASDSFKAAPFFRIPSSVRNALHWMKNQLPKLDLMDLFPIGIEGIQGVIVLGNQSTPYLFVSEFQRAEGAYGYVQAKSKYDPHRTLLTLRFHRASINLVENDHYADSMTTIGHLAHDCISQYASPSDHLQPRLFVKLWRQLKLFAFMDEYMTPQNGLCQQRSTLHKKRVDDATPFGADFIELEYARETKLLDAPVLDVSYYSDIPGQVPADVELSFKNADDHFNIGNGDTDPEWGIDVVVYKGTIRYGPWADRQRGGLQRIFFPSSWQNTEVTPRLDPGDQRLSTTLQILVELRDNTTLQIPFREASKDWQWDGESENQNRPRKREPATLQITAGDSSSVRFTIPMVSDHNGYESTVEVHLDAITVTSSLSDIKLVQAETCRIHCGMPSPLQWNGERTWHVSVTLRDPVLYLVRDQINMFIDLGKDWASGPPHDYYRFIPTIYTIDVDMHHYNLNLYINDNNIIDRPHVSEENVLFTTSASYLKSRVTIPSNIFRPDKTTVSFAVDAPDATVLLSLPRWNTYALHAPKDGNTLGKARSIRLEGSYLYFSQVREHNVEQLHLKISGNEIVYKALGWSIRYFMVLKDNYFGSFTHFSTLCEFLENKRQGIPFGDPIILKYRPGKANMLQVTMVVEVSASTVVVPAGLPSYESISDWDTPGEHGIGPCLLLHVPELQLQLRLHAYFMEMSLNINTISGNIDVNYPERLRASKCKTTGAQDLLLIDGIDISALRLFGPQPRTATYVCIWALQLGQVRTVLSASDARILVAAGNAFHVNFVDLFNAPSSEFLPNIEPDVTFYKVSIKEIDATWRTEHAALSVVIPLGLKVDSNDLGSQFHQRITSVRIPDIVAKLLISGKQERSPWLEAAVFEAHVSLDLYSAPHGHGSHVRTQTEFIKEQDRETGRAQRMFGQYLSSIDGEPVQTSGSEQSYLNGLFIPQPPVPNLSRKTQSNKGPKPRRKAEYEKLADASDSDAETGISEAERDARLARTRNATPIPRTIQEEDITSGDESDDADLTDESTSESVWSDQDSSDSAKDSMLMHYARACRHYKLRRGGKDIIWEGSPFIMVKNKRISMKPVLGGSLPIRGMDMDDFKPDDDCDVTTLHVHFTDTTEFRLTPLIVPAMGFLEEDAEHHLLGPELWIDSLLVKQLSIFLDTGKPPTCLNWKVNVSSVVLHVVQHVSMVDETQPLIAVDVHKEQPPSKLDNMATLELGIQNFTTSGTKRAGNSAHQLAFRSLSFSLKTTLDKFIMLSSLPGETSLSVTFTSSKLSCNRTSMNVELGLAKLSIGQRSPEFILAAGFAIAHNAKRAMDVIKRYQEFMTATRRVMLFNILSFSRDLPVVEPLSTIQPSYLVQHGVPSGLRSDAKFKFLFHLRDCLWNLKPEQRASLQVEKYKNDADLREELESRSRALDPDTPVVMIETLFGKPVRTQMAEDTRRAEPFLSFVSAKSGGVTLDILQPSGKLAGQFRLSNLRSIMRGTSYDVLRPSHTRNMSQTSLRGDKQLPVQKTLVSFVLGDITLVLLPHVMTFFQHAVRLKPPLIDQGPMSSTLQATTKRQPRFRSINAVIFLNHLHIQAAAENLILEMGLRRVQATSSSLSRSQGLREQSTNNALFVGKMYVRARSPQTAQVDGHDILAALEMASGTVSLVTRQEPKSRPRIRLVSSFGDVQLNVPRSALRLYRFIEEWRDDYLPGLENTLNSLLSEMKKTAKTPQAISALEQRPAVIQLHGRVNHVGVALQVMHGTWLSMDVHDTIGNVASANVTSPIAAYTFGLQISSATLSVSAKPAMHVKMALPPFIISGRYDSLSVHVLALVDFIDLKIKPVDWDKLLVVQQKFGQDFNDLLSLMHEASLKRAMHKQTSEQRETRLKYRGSLKMKGFRVGLEGAASTLYLECRDIGSSLDSATGNAWNLTLSNLALSLAPRRVHQHGSAFSRRRRSAFVIIDIMVKTESRSAQASLDVEKGLRISITKIHAVMQASSISEMNDFIDELHTEVLSRKEQRSLELAAFKEKARSILRTFEVRIKDTGLDKTTSWLDAYVVDIIVQNVGVAFPLTYSPDLQIPEKRSLETEAVRAFLFSTVKVEFGTHRGETGQVVVTDLSFQFVPHFRQSVPGDFLGDNHNTRNRLLYPEMKAHVRSVQSLAKRRVWMGAVVSGFILDLDSTIPDYIFSAIDVYHQGRESVERLSATVPLPQWSPDQSPLGTPTEDSTSSTSGVFASLKFLRGKIRLFSEQAREMTRPLLSGASSKDASDDQLLQLGVEIFKLPEVSVWAEYRAVLSQKTNAAHPEPSTLMFKSTVHSSENTLRPTLLHFLTEVVNYIEDHWRNVSHRPSSQLPPTTPKLFISHSTPSNFASSIGLRISFSLRIDRSKLELTCLPDVNVMAGLHWESGGFVINVTPATQKVTFTGVVGGLTAGLKHGFLSEDCVKLDARNLTFSVTFGKISDLSSDPVNYLSVVLDTEFLAGVRLSRLQDVLCFKAVWLDNIPVPSTQLTAPNTSAKTVVSGSRPRIQGPTTAILIRARQIKTDVDLGQSISLVTVNLSDIVLRTKSSDLLYEVSISVGTLELIAKGNMAGRIHVQNCVFSTSRRIGDHAPHQGRMLDLRMTSGPVCMDLDSEHQKLLRYRAEPIAIEIYDDWSFLTSATQAGPQPLQLAFTVASPEILAIVTIGTIPKLMAYANRFEATLDAQREGASRESAAFNRTRTPKVDNPLSTVAEAMLQSAKTRLTQVENALTYLIQQHMSFRLDRLQLVVFPRTMQDGELASFIGDTVRARLNRVVDFVNSPARRHLHLSFSSLSISRYVQLSHSAASSDPLQCHEWLKVLLNGAPEATIVGLPAMRMRMISSEEVLAQPKHLIYDFNSEFVYRKGKIQVPEDIFITLNISLYSWLTILRKNMTRDMEQVRATVDRQPSTKISPLSPRTSGRRHPDPKESSGATKESHMTMPVAEKPPFSATASPTSLLSPVAQGKSHVADIIYEPRSRRIERLKLRQLGEATPDVMHPFFMKKSGFNLEESLPQYVHEYATAPLEEIMEALLKLYSRQLPSSKRRDSS